MTSKVSFKILVEENDMKLEVFLTDNGDLAFRMTNTDGTLNACIEADAYKFEEGLGALLDTIDDDAEHDHSTCGHDHHHHDPCCCEDEDDEDDDDLLSSPC